MDIHLVPVGSGGNEDDDDRMPFEFTDTARRRRGPFTERGRVAAAGFVDGFLETLNKSVRGKANSTTA
jgi:hypothetical protein